MKVATRDWDDPVAWNLVTVYHKNSFKDGKRPVVQVQTFETKKEAINAQVRERKRWKKSSWPGVYWGFVCRSLTPDMFGDVIPIELLSEKKTSLAD